MSSIRIRPRIRAFSNHSQETLINVYKDIISSGKYPFHAKIVQQHISVKCLDTEQHFWTPELTLEVTRNYLQDDEGSDHKEPTMIKGYISPNPSVWALFLFTYVALGLFSFGFMVYGTSQMMLNQPTQMLWYALGCLLLIGIVFIASQIGQRLGERQTNKLLEFVNEGLFEK